MSCFLQLRQQREEAHQQLLLVQGSALAVEANSTQEDFQANGTAPVYALTEVASATRNCSVNSTVRVQVGNASAKITFGRWVRNGTSGFYHCSKVNPRFGGVLMLHCEDGKLTGDSRGCFPYADEQSCLEQKRQLEDT